jgi:F420H(2)-dependent quinone reductase
MSTRTPSPGIKAFLKFHQWLYETTGGLLGHHLTRVPSLLLRTTGRKSGQQRTVALVYARDGDKKSPAGYVLVASNHGMDRPPAWLLNLEANPKAEAQIARHKRPVVAEVYWPGDHEYARLWALANDQQRQRFERYQAGTARRIPVVRLVPT